MMGLAWYISTKRKIPGLDTSVDGKAIAHADERKLATLVQELGVKPLEDFFSASPEELAGLFGDPEEVATGMPEMPKEAWFSAVEGLATVRPLLAYLKQHNGEFEDQEGIVRDLEEYERVLDILAREGIGWHLSIDI